MTPPRAAALALLLATLPLSAHATTTPRASATLDVVGENGQHVTTVHTDLSSDEGRISSALVPETSAATWPAYFIEMKLRAAVGGQRHVDIVVTGPLASQEAFAPVMEARLLDRILIDCDNGRAPCPQRADYEKRARELRQMANQSQSAASAPLAADGTARLDVPVTSAKWLLRAKVEPAPSP